MRPQSRRNPRESTTMDVSTIVTQTIINLLEQGILPWRRPWADGGFREISSARDVPRETISRRETCWSGRKSKALPLVHEIGTVTSVLLAEAVWGYLVAVELMPNAFGDARRAGLCNNLR